MGEPSATASVDATRPTSRAGYVLAVLTAAYAVNFLDRQVVNILAESIKRDLQISDTQLGLLTGTA
jgi:MFS transporter, Spinster family, sphingosine-1-phosphate transporter